MKHFRVCGLIIVFALAPALRADVTMRQTMSIHFGTFLPPAATDAMKGALGTMLANGIIVQLKGDLVSCTMGPLGMITDYAKGTITVFNPQTKRYATVPLTDYMSQILASQKAPPIPAEAQKMIAAMKFDVKTEKSGEKATIHGIATEESIIKVSIEMPGMPGPGMRAEIHLWVANGEELKQMPALKELAAYATRSKSGMDPVEMLTKAFGSVPGIGEKMRGPMAEIMKVAGSIVIQMKEAFFMPAMNAQEPMMEMTMDLAELSTSSIPDTTFETPVGYEAAPIAELVGPMMPKAAAK
jgi:hypothetical protein